MRHLKAGNRLGLTTAHRRSMMRNMVTSIIENGQITCTLARAKAVRSPLEKMISWGKVGSLNARRRALRFVKSKKAMEQLFGDLAERYKDRQGGYSRIIKLGKNRLGDNSEMAIVQLLGSEMDQLSSLKDKPSKKKNKNKKDSKILKEVTEDILTKTEDQGKSNSETENNISEKNLELAQPEVSDEIKKDDDNSSKIQDDLDTKTEGKIVIPEEEAKDKELVTKENNVNFKEKKIDLINENENASDTSSNEIENTSVEEKTFLEGEKKIASEDLAEDEANFTNQDITKQKNEKEIASGVPANVKNSQKNSD